MPLSGPLPRNLGVLSAERPEQGCVPFVFEKIFTASSTTTYELCVASFTFKVFALYTINNSAPGGAATVQLRNGTTAVTDALDCNDADNTVSMCTTVDDASATFNPGDSLNILLAGANIASLAARVYVLCIPIE